MSPYLPPVVIEVEGTSDGFLSTLATVKAALEDFASTVYKAKLGVTLPSLTTAIKTAQAEGDALAKDHPVSMPFQIEGLSAAAAKIVADAKALSSVAKAHPVDMPLDTTGAGALVGKVLADIAAANAAARAHPVTIPVTPEGGGAAAAVGAAAGGSSSSSSGYLGSLFAGLLGAKSASGASSGLSKILSFLIGDLAGGAGSSGGGILSGIPGIGAAAGALPATGILGSAAGLGSESLIIGPLLGLVGSMIGGVLGAGFLGTGAAGVGAVGFGTDLAGIGQAMGDLSKYRTALSQLNTAIVTYGANSTQAAQAGRQLNAFLASMPTVAIPNMEKLSKNITSFISLFDKKTGSAESKGMTILTTLVTTAKKFVSTIGEFATINMGTIHTGLQPFLNWLSTTGMKTFKKLEADFSKSLPTGQSALEGAFETLVHVVTDVAPSLGKMVTTINNFFAKLNTEKGQKSLTSFIQKMIGDFNAWVGFFKQAAALFTAILPDFAGLGASIVNNIFTPMLKSLTTFVKGISPTLKEFFGVHRTLIATGFGSVIKSIMPVIEQLIEGFINLAIAVRPLTTGALEDVASVIKTVDTLLMTIAKLITGKISFGTAASNIGKSVGGTAEQIGKSVANVALTTAFKSGESLGKKIHATGTNWDTWFGLTVKKFASGLWDSIFGGGSATTGAAEGSMVAGMTKAAAQALLAEMAKTKGLAKADANIKKTLEAVVAGKSVAGTSSSLGITLKSLSSTLSTDLTTALDHLNLAATIAKQLKGASVGKAFVTELDGSLTAHMKTLESTAKTVAEKAHDSFWTNLHAARLGREADQHIASGMKATESTVVNEASALGAKAAAAFNKAFNAGTGGKGGSTSVAAVVNRLKSGSTR